MNPFIEFYQDPVGVLAALGYVLLLLCLLAVTIAACWRNALTIHIQWRRGTWKYDPPTSWLLRVAAIPLVLAIDAWAVAALVWLLT